MSQSNASPSNGPPDRRAFMRKTTLAALAASTPVAGALALPRSVHAAGSDILKIGLVGCGDRGSGAAVNAMDADPHAKLYAMGDAFADRLKASLANLKQVKGAQVDVMPERCFVGLESYRRVIDS